jgi:pyruvate kinase
MSLPTNKTKIVCTIGPASDSPEVLEKMMRAGMNSVRLNFSHGDFDSHKKLIDKVRAVS